MTTLDHLVVAARSLGEGVAFVEGRLGVPMSGGGRHEGLGTHNRLLRLGDGPDGTGQYLEVIAPDPASEVPPAWFGLSDPAVRARLERGPTLLTWVTRVPDLGEAVSRGGLGGPDFEVRTASRGELSWLFGAPRGGGLAWDGVVPALITWLGEPHPTERMDAVGVRLIRLVASHPDPVGVRRALAQLGVREAGQQTSGGAGPIEVREGPARLEATLTTPRGEITLT